MLMPIKIGSKGRFCGFRAKYARSLPARLTSHQPPMMRVRRQWDVTIDQMKKDGATKRVKQLTDLSTVVKARKRWPQNHLLPIARMSLRQVFRAHRTLCCVNRRKSLGKVDHTRASR